jgi:hypothetical protein
VPSVSLHEDGVGGVDHDLPDVVVGEEWPERPVAGEVPHRSFADQVGVRQVVGPEASLEIVVPAGDFVVDEGPKCLLRCRRVEVEHLVLCPSLNGLLNLGER